MPNARTASTAARTGLALGVLFDETVSLYLRLTADAAMIHRFGVVSGPRRTVLASLARAGPRTVADMARARGQSRQRFQPLVNRLLEERLVEARPNSRHKASPLIALTARGEAEVRRLLDREAALREGMVLPSSPDKILRAAALLREVREASAAQLPGLLARLPDAGSRKTSKTLRRALPG